MTITQGTTLKRNNRFYYAEGPQETVPAAQSSSFYTRIPVLSKFGRGWLFGDDGAFWTREQYYRLVLWKMEFNANPSESDPTPKDLQVLNTCPDLWAFIDAECA